MTEPTPTPEPSEAGGRVADAVRGHWVDRHAPASLRPYLRLSRIERPIGWWLLLLPCWWGALLAASSAGQFGLRELWIMVGCWAGAILMRGAGCTWNDITDRKIDAAVARTHSRPIPSGQVSVRQAAVWMGLQAMVALAILLTFHPLAILLGLVSLGPVAIYPFAKRFTWWPQVFLGIAFNWGALLAFAAVAGELRPEAGLLYFAGMAWTLFYDTIYAHQDKEDDALIGVKSTARLFAERTPRWLRRFLVVAVVLMGAAVVEAFVDTNVLKLVIGLGAPWAFGWHMAWQLSRLDIDDGDRCLMLFRSNRNAGLLAALFIAASLFV